MTQDVCGILQLQNLPISSTEFIFHCSAASKWICPLFVFPGQLTWAATPPNKVVQQKYKH